MTIWFISDTHFDHANMVYKFKLEDGSPMRPFSSPEEMNETIIARWNEYVRPSDHIYHLGDVTMHRQIGQIKHSVLDRLNGHKRLLLGNHDLDTVQNYALWFEKIMAVRVLEDMIFTHIPVHPQSLGRFRANVHGHTHQHVYPAHRREHDNVLIPYLNVCVEQTNYRPVSLDELKARL